MIANTYYFLGFLITTGKNLAQNTMKFPLVPYTNKKHSSIQPPPHQTKHNNKPFLLHFSGQGQSSAKSCTVSDLVSLPVDPQAKSVWSNLVCTIASVTDGNLWYLAHPESNKKVVPKDGKYYCENDGTWCDQPVRR